MSKSKITNILQLLDLGSITYIEYEAGDCSPWRFRIKLNGKDEIIDVLSLLHENDTIAKNYEQDFLKNLDKFIDLEMLIFGSAGEIVFTSFPASLKTLVLSHPSCDIKDFNGSVFISEDTDSCFEKNRHLPASTPDTWIPYTQELRDEFKMFEKSKHSNM